MKQIVLSLVTIIAMSSIAFSEENIAYNESTEENPPEDKGFYVGLAYSHLSHDVDHEELTTNYELDFNAVMLGVGYKFNPYIAVEGRYNISFGDTDMDDILIQADLSILSLFIKPIYPIAPEMDIYALLGYSLTNAEHVPTITSLDEGSFSWGGGVSYDLTEDFSIFAEYAQLYNGTLNGFDHVVDSFNIGVTYEFRQNLF